jgi:hypothetical protein
MLKAPRIMLKAPSVAMESQSITIKAPSITIEALSITIKAPRIMLQALRIMLKDYHHIKILHFGDSLFSRGYIYKNLHFQESTFALKNLDFEFQVIGK